MDNDPGIPLFGKRGIPGPLPEKLSVSLSLWERAGVRVKFTVFVTPAKPVEKFLEKGAGKTFLSKKVFPATPLRRKRNHA